MDILVILILILINGLFVMAEMALVASKRPRLEAAAGRGSVGARTALKLMDNPTRFFSITQVAITLTVILSGALGEETLADDLRKWVEHYPRFAAYSHSIAFTAIVLVITYVSLILGELLPKRLAQINPEFWATATAIPMQVVSRMAAPVILLLTVSTNLLLKLLPFRARTDPEGTELEVKALMKSGAAAGVFHEEEQRIVERVFRLSDQTVKALMVPRTDIEWLGAEDTVARIRVAIATSTHSHFPVCKTGLDDLVGVVHVKDLVKAGIIADDVSLSEVMHQPLFVPETTPALKVLELFKENKDHVAFVLDEYGVVEGLVTLNDVVAAIVGEVTRHDEADEPMVVRRKDGSYLLDGMLPVDELKALLAGAVRKEETSVATVALPKEDEADFQTLGGWVFAYLGRIPATGDTFEFGRFYFEIMDMDRQRVDKVLLTIEPEAAPGKAEEK